MSRTKDEAVDILNQEKNPVCKALNKAGTLLDKWLTEYSGLLFQEGGDGIVEEDFAYLTSRLQELERISRLVEIYTDKKFTEC